MIVLVEILFKVLLFIFDEMGKGVFRIFFVNVEVVFCKVLGVFLRWGEEVGMIYK